MAEEEQPSSAVATAAVAPSTSSSSLKTADGEELLSSIEITTTPTTTTTVTENPEELQKSSSKRNNDDDNVDDIFCDTIIKNERENDDDDDPESKKELDDLFVSIVNNERIVEDQSQQQPSTTMIEGDQFMIKQEQDVDQLDSVLEHIQMDSSKQIQWSSTRENNENNIISKKDIAPEDSVDSSPGKHDRELLNHQERKQENNEINECSETVVVKNEIFQENQINNELLVDDDQLDSHQTAIKTPILISNTSMSSLSSSPLAHHETSIQMPSSSNTTKTNVVNTAKLEASQSSPSSPLVAARIETDSKATSDGGISLADPFTSTAITMTTLTDTSLHDSINSPTISSPSTTSATNLVNYNHPDQNRNTVTPNLDTESTLTNLNYNIDGSDHGIEKTFEQLMTLEREEKILEETQSKLPLTNDDDLMVENLDAFLDTDDSVRFQDIGHPHKEELNDDNDDDDDDGQHHIKASLDLFAKIKFSLCDNVPDGEKIKKVMVGHGAKFLNYLSDSVTHFIADDADHPSVSEAIDIYEKPVVTSQWVWLSLRANQVLPIQPFILVIDDRQTRLFSNIIACPSQISSNDCKKLWSMVTFYGGRFQLHLDSNCTHLLTTKITGKKYEMAIVSKNGDDDNNNKSSLASIVTPDWIIDSITQMKLCKEEHYHPRLLVNYNQDHNRMLTTNVSNNNKNRPLVNDGNIKLQQQRQNTETTIFKSNKTSTSVITTKSVTMTISTEAITVKKSNDSSMLPELSSSSVVDSILPLSSTSPMTSQKQPNQQQIFSSSFSSSSSKPLFVPAMSNNNNNINHSLSTTTTTTTPTTTVPHHQQTHPQQQNFFNQKIQPQTSSLTTTAAATVNESLSVAKQNSSQNLAPQQQQHQQIRHPQMVSPAIMPRLPNNQMVNLNQQQQQQLRMQMIQPQQQQPQPNVQYQHQQQPQIRHQIIHAVKGQPIVNQQQQQQQNIVASVGGQQIMRPQQMMLQQPGNNYPQTNQLTSSGQYQQQMMANPNRKPVFIQQQQPQQIYQNQPFVRGGPYNIRVCGKPQQQQSQTMILQQQQPGMIPRQQVNSPSTNGNQMTMQQYRQQQFANQNQPQQFRPRQQVVAPPQQYARPIPPGSVPPQQQQQFVVNNKPPMIRMVQQQQSPMANQQFNQNYVMDQNQSQSPQMSPNIQGQTGPRMPMLRIAVPQQQQLQQPVLVRQMQPQHQPNMIRPGINHNLQYAQQTVMDSKQIPRSVGGHTVQQMPFAMRQQVSPQRWSQPDFNNQQQQQQQYLPNRTQIMPVQQQQQQQQQQQPWIRQPASQQMQPQPRFQPGPPQMVRLTTKPVQTHPNQQQPYYDPTIINNKVRASITQNNNLLQQQNVQQAIPASVTPVSQIVSTISGTPVPMQQQPFSNSNSTIIGNGGNLPSAKTILISSPATSSNMSACSSPSQQQLHPQQQSPTTTTTPVGTPTISGSTSSGSSSSSVVNEKTKTALANLLNNRLNLQLQQQQQIRATNEIATTTPPCSSPSSPSIANCTTNNKITLQPVPVGSGGGTGGANNNNLMVANQSAIHHGQHYNLQDPITGHQHHPATHGPPSQPSMVPYGASQQLYRPPQITPSPHHQHHQQQQPSMNYGHHPPPPTHHSPHHHPTIPGSPLTPGKPGAFPSPGTPIASTTSPSTLSPTTMVGHSGQQASPASGLHSQSPSPLQSFQHHHLSQHHSMHGQHHLQHQHHPQAATPHLSSSQQYGPQSVHPHIKPHQHPHHQSLMVHNQALPPPQPPVQPVQQNMIRYYGHDPPQGSTISPDCCLIRCVFYISRTYLENPCTAKLVPGWQRTIKKFGGNVVDSLNSPDCNVTHVLTDHMNWPLKAQSQQQLVQQDGKRYVSIFWLNEVIETHRLLPPWRFYHLPMAFPPQAKPCKNHVISVTNFEPQERSMIKHFVEKIGARYTEYLTQKNTILICKKPIGTKHHKAIEWGLAIVNITWLQDVLFGNADIISTGNLPKKYKIFDQNSTKSKMSKNQNESLTQMMQRDTFKVDYSVIHSLMVPWRSPIKYDSEDLRRHEQRIAELKCFQKQSETLKDTEKSKTIENGGLILDPCNQDLKEEHQSSSSAASTSEMRLANGDQGEEESNSSSSNFMSAGTEISNQGTKRTLEQEDIKQKDNLMFSQPSLPNGDVNDDHETLMPSFKRIKRENNDEDAMILDSMEPMNHDRNKEEEDILLVNHNHTNHGEEENSCQTSDSFDTTNVTMINGGGDSFFGSSSTVGIMINGNNSDNSNNSMSSNNCGNDSNNQIAIDMVPSSNNQDSSSSAQFKVPFDVRKPSPTQQSPKEMVILLMGVKQPKLYEHYRQAVKTLGGKLVRSKINDNKNAVVETVDPTKATHLVIGHDYQTLLPKISINFLCAFARAQYMIKSDWLEDSLKSEHFLPEHDYQICNENLDSNGSSSRGEKSSHAAVAGNDIEPLNCLKFDSYQLDLCKSWQRRRANLFQNLLFLLTPSLIPTPSILKQVIEANSGQAVLKRMPNRRQLMELFTVEKRSKISANHSTDSSSSQFFRKVIVITCENDMHLLPDYMIQCRHVEIVNSNFIINSILKQRLSYEPFRIASNIPSTAIRPIGKIGSTSNPNIILNMPSGTGTKNNNSHQTIITKDSNNNSQPINNPDKMSSSLGIVPPTASK